MQEPTFYAHPVYNQPQQSYQPERAQPAARSVAQRLSYFVLPLLVVALVGGSIYWLQWAVQRGLTIGYPKPEISFVSPYSNIQINDVVHFSVNSSGRELTYSWNFGDGSYGDGPTPSHMYSQWSANAPFTVTVTVTDGIGQTNTATTSVTVTPPLPTASFTYSQSYYSGYMYFDASGSSAYQGIGISAYKWDFGDGSTDSTSYSQENHTFSSTGTYTVTLTVTDSTGQDSTPYSQVVTVQ